MSGTFWTIEQVEPIIRERDRLRAENEALKAELEPCRQYQKEGESLAECLERNRRDASRAIRLYGDTKAELAEVVGEQYAAREE